MIGSDQNGDELWGMWDGQCQACDMWGRVNDMMLCEDCATKLERDLIRQRDWDYTVSAFGLSPDDREELRRQVIAQFGQALELIVPPKQTRKSRSPQKRKKRGAGK
jgi:hypothetical protein